MGDILVYIMAAWTVLSIATLVIWNGIVRGQREATSLMHEGSRIRDSWFEKQQDAETM